MADCSGSAPFKGLLKYDDKDRAINQYTRSPGAAPVGQAFRSQQFATQDHAGYSSFIRGERSSLLSNPMPAQGTAISSSNDDFVPRMAQGTSSYTPFPDWSAVSGPPEPFQPSVFASQGPGSEWSREFRPVPTVAPVHAEDTHSKTASRVGYPNAPEVPGSAPSWPHPRVVMAAPVPSFANVSDMRFPGSEVGRQSHHTEPRNVVMDEVDEVLQQIADELDETSQCERSGPQVMASSYGHDGGVPVGRDSIPITYKQTPARNGSEHRLPFEETEESVAQNDSIGNESTVTEIAKRILASVDHEQDTKWQESSFLALMRDFRDGRKDIVENQIL